MFQWMNKNLFSIFMYYLNSLQCFSIKDFYSAKWLFDVLNKLELIMVFIQHFFSVLCPAFIKLNATEFSWPSRDFIFRQAKQKIKFLHDKLFNSILQYFRNWNRIITHFVDWLTFIFFFPKMESLYVYWFHNIHDIFHNQFLDFRSCQVRGHW